MEGELSMEVPLNNIYPLRISWLVVQLLKSTTTFCQLSQNYVFGPFHTRGHKNRTDQEFALILLPPHFAPSEEEPGPAT